MRRRVVGLVFLTTAFALLLLAIPLGLDVKSRIRNDERSKLARLAAITASDLSAEGLNGSDPIELPTLPSLTKRLGIYNENGTLQRGTGPTRIDIALAKLRLGNVVDEHIGSELVVAVPMVVDENLSAVVRAASSDSSVDRLTRSAWLRISAVAVGALMAATFTALLLANRLLRPLRRTHDMALRIGTGEHGQPPTLSGIGEIDAIASAMSLSSQRVDDALTRERAFSSDVSHQLRTPITGLRLTLENELERPGPDREDALRSALQSVDHLEVTVEGLLQLARDTMSQRNAVDAAEPLNEVGARWVTKYATGNRKLTWPDQKVPLIVKASLSALREILDVLCANAYSHATGDATLTIEFRDHFVVFVMSDTGPGLVDPSRIFLRRNNESTGQGIGLALARRLAEAEGGQLLLTQHQPFCRFELLLPA